VTRLLIAADSQLMREGLERLAASNPSFEIIGTFRDLSAVEDLRPDLVLAALPREDLIPAPAIVWLTESARPEWSREISRSGVRAVLPRDASPGEILAALEAAASGLAVIDPRDLESLLPDGSSHDSSLTPREIEVLRLLAEGAANKTIAWKLGISEHTAKFHVASILTKLNAGSRAEAVAIGIRRGLVLL
jgi:DNA-binding NarL/FixJ family response regulator